MDIDRTDPSSTLPRSGRPQARGIKTRDQLLLAGRDLFAANGYEGTSIGEIARTAGVGVGTVYHHFSDKLALFLELLRNHEGALLLIDPDSEGALSLALEGRNTADGILAILRIGVELRRLNPSLYLIARDLARREPEVDACCAEIEQAYRLQIQRAIELGQNLGRFRPEVDAEAAAFLSQRFFHSATSQIAELPPEADVEPLLQVFAELVCRYLLVP